MAGEPVPFPQQLLARAHSPSVAESNYLERVVKRPLHILPSTPVPSARAVRRRARHSRQENGRKRSKLKPRPLSAAKKRALGLLEIDKEQQKYSIYEGLHKLWVGYMREILGMGEEEGGRTFVTAQSSG